MIEHVDLPGRILVVRCSLDEPFLCEGLEATVNDRLVQLSLRLQMFPPDTWSQQS